MQYLYFVWFISFNFTIFLYSCCSVPARMENRKIKLEDLTRLGDEIIIDKVDDNDGINPVQHLINEEIASFIDKPKEEQHTKPAGFFSHVPSTELKKNIDKILKARERGEERTRKSIQFDFDRKMQRIKRIKSRTYRKMKRKEKIRKEEELGISTEEENSESSEQNEINEASSEKNDEFKTEVNNELNMLPNIQQINEMAGATLNKQQKKVLEIFEESDCAENEAEFKKEKEIVVEEDAPKIIESVQPGWNEWAGEGIITEKRADNTIINIKDGIREKDRKDYREDHVIINESIRVPEKYKSELPYGYSYKAYRDKMNVMVSPETTSSRIFNRFVKLADKNNEIAGKSIKPAEYEPEY